MRPLVRDALFCVLLAAAAVLAWPVTPWTEVTQYDVVITATGGKNAQSRGSEVWISAVPPEIDLAALAATSQPAGGWEQRDAILVSYRNQPATLRYSGPLSVDAAFVFRRHDWSGEAKIEINGETRTLDLYSTARTTETVNVAVSEFPVRTPKYQGYWGKFLGLVLVWSTVIGVGLYGARRFRPSAVPPPTRTFLYDAARYSVPAFAIFAIVLLGTWPALMSGDSIAQWWELHTGTFSNAHPVIHTVLFGGPGYLLGSPGWSMVIQITLLAFACGVLASEIRRWGVPSGWVWGCVILVPMLPGVHLLSTVFWKDIPYTAILVFFTAQLMAIVRTRGAVLADIPFLSALSLTVFLTATLRHNGLIIPLGLIVLFVLAWRPFPRRLAAAFLTFGVVLPLLWTIFALPALGVKPIGRHYAGGVPLHFLAAMVHADVPIDVDTEARLQSILPLETWKKNYDCLTFVPLFWAEGIKYEKIDETLFAPMVRLSIQHPLKAIDHLACVTSALWRLSPTPGFIYALTPLSMGRVTAPYDQLGLVEAPVSTAVQQFLRDDLAWTTSSPLKTVIFWRPALPLFILAFFVYLSWGRASLPTIIAAVGPAVLNSLSLVPLALSQDFRYQLILYMVVPFIGILLFFLSRQQDGSGSKSAYSHA